MTALLLAAGSCPAIGDPSRPPLTSIPWELLDRDTVIPHAVRSGWVERTIEACRAVSLGEAYARAGLDVSAHAFRLQVYKSQFAMLVEAGGHVLKVYPVSFSGTPIGTKLRLGDRRTPEGAYTVLKHVSPTYGLSLFVCYPNWVDAFRAFLADDLTYTQFHHVELALQSGVPPPQNTPLGAQILIHTSPTRRDTCSTCDNWSFGCVVMEPRDLDELLAVVPWGRPLNLTIHPVDVPLVPQDLPAMDPMRIP
jgi:hypothetical protein